MQLLTPTCTWVQLTFKKNIKWLKQEKMLYQFLGLLNFFSQKRNTKEFCLKTKDLKDKYMK